MQPSVSARLDRALDALDQLLVTLHLHFASNVSHVYLIPTNFSFVPPPFLHLHVSCHLFSVVFLSSGVRRKGIAFIADSNGMELARVCFPCDEFQECRDIHKSCKRDSRNGNLLGGIDDLSCVNNNTPLLLCMHTVTASTPDFDHDHRLQRRILGSCSNVSRHELIHVRSANGLGETDCFATTNLLYLLQFFHSSDCKAAPLTRQRRFLGVRTTCSM